MPYDNGITELVRLVALFSIVKNEFLNERHFLVKVSKVFPSDERRFPELLYHSPAGISGMHNGS